jgi:hypothetical protein
MRTSVESVWLFKLVKTKENSYHQTIIKSSRQITFNGVRMQPVTTFQIKEYIANVELLAGCKKKQKKTSSTLLVSPKIETVKISKTLSKAEISSDFLQNSVQGKTLLSIHTQALAKGLLPDNQGIDFSETLDADASFGKAFALLKSLYTEKDEDAIFQSAKDTDALFFNTLNLLRHDIRIHVANTRQDKGCFVLFRKMRSSFISKIINSEFIKELENIHLRQGVELFCKGGKSQLEQTLTDALTQLQLEAIILHTPQSKTCIALLIDVKNLRLGDPHTGFTRFQEKQALVDHVIEHIETQIGFEPELSFELITLRNYSGSTLNKLKQAIQNNKIINRLRSCNFTKPIKNK